MYVNSPNFIVLYQNCSSLLVTSLSSVVKHSRNQGEKNQQWSLLDLRRYMHRLTTFHLKFPDFSSGAGNIYQVPKKWLWTRVPVPGTTLDKYISLSSFKYREIIELLTTLFGASAIL